MSGKSLDSFPLFIPHTFPIGRFLWEALAYFLWVVLGSNKS